MDGFSIQNPEYKPAMLANKNSELYKEAEKLWNENRDLIFSEGDSTEKNDGLDKENTSSELYKEAEKMWNKNRNLFFSKKENLSENPNGLEVS